MATIICKFDMCPYLSGKLGDPIRFCQSDLISIMANGGCGILFKPDGVIRPEMQSIIQEKMKNVNG